VVFVLRAIAAWDHNVEPYLAHDDVLEATDGNDISVRTTRIYDVNLCEGWFG
jgi:hypothetical protein